MGEQLATILVTWFVVIDPAGMAPVFLTLTRDHPHADRRVTARHAILIAAIVLTAFALGGQYLLTVIGISLPALRIAGGILLLLLAVEMVFARHSGLRSTTEVEAREARVREDVAVFPLAVPLLAGPAAITSAILLMEDVRGDLILQGAVICGMLLVLGITYIMFLFASAVMTRIGVTGVNVIGRAFGIILAALAVQYIIDGARAAFPALTG